jgi:hypothetical protein
MSDQLIAEAATRTTHNKQNRRTSTPSEGFVSAASAIERPQTQDLDRAAAGIDNKSSITWYYNLASQFTNSTTPACPNYKVLVTAFQYLQLHRPLSVVVFGFSYSGILIYVLFIH